MMNKEFFIERYGSTYSQREAGVIATSVVVSELFFGHPDLRKGLVFYSMEKEALVFLNPENGAILFYLDGVSYPQGRFHLEKFLRDSGFLRER